MIKFNGIGASNGISNAKAYILKDNMPKIIRKIIKEPQTEIAKFENAQKIAAEQIINLKKKAIEKLGTEKAIVFDAHLGILMDPEMISQVNNKIKLEKINASFAISEVANIFKQMFLSMDSDYMKERVADVTDVTTRLIKIIEGIEIKDLSLINEEVIIIAHDLTPSETSQLNIKFIKGFITEIGGKTSHSAIMARTLEIPAIVGVGSVVFDILENQMILMDGNSGEIIINPNTQIIKDFKEKTENLKKTRKIELTFKNKNSISKDGWHTEISSNIGSPNDIESVNNNGSDGIGLFRTEFLYMDAEDWPTEEEQFQAYKKVLESVKGRVVIRTLDIGGDKTLNYFKFPYEMNPFLGYRAIRLQLDKTDIFDIQIRALLRASAFGKLAVNIPMISIIEEFKMVKERFKKNEKKLKSEGYKIGKYELGIMVEVPSTVELADKFAKYADFFSVGTNDLIQYTFAADRMSKSVSYLYQPFSPATLRKLKRIIDASHKEGKWTAICGEVASEPMLTPVLVGMGLDEFSMSSTSILQIRKIVSEINKSEAEKLVDLVLNVETQEEVKKLIQLFLDKNNILL
ncbi:MAG: phosphoenolpyruvate--protein phosphotransferase [Mycoplasmataceae bacterium]|nr:phosphoenolpyruvate--protein phosphotransferase [Mycoplasmataceae bacterium]